MVFIVIMDRLTSTNLVLFIFLLNLFFVLGYDRGREGMANHHHHHHHQPQKLSIVNMLRTTTSTYCDKVRASVNQAHAYFFPPTLDFRISDEAKEDAGGDGGGGGGATEKVKEAVTRSLGKTKQTLEDSAKTAAEIAGETMEKIKDIVKKTFSKRTPRPEPEL